ncbi:MAG: class D beta-lactamase [Campylobacteraceae bacterium]|nr:class D beta-lactamase [Campylobacteraceae bacterium]
MIVKLLFLIGSFMFASEPNFGAYDGSAVILDLNSSKRDVFGTYVDERLHPCSTFKIPNSMIALDSQVINDENETIVWDGEIREYAFWNKDHSMRSAISVSTVWFYQELAKRIGAKKMQEMVAKIDYGNNDTSQTLTTFWLGNGSLKISPNEQVKFLSKLIREELPFTHRTMVIVKDIMTLEKKKNYTFSGKTGSCSGIGWFVGFVEEPQSTKVFTFVVKEAKGLVG